MAKHQFQTEVGQLLHLMTHSLYSHKEIFIRELVSNASDAIDKLNYLRLTQEKLKDDKWSGTINIKIDEKDSSITIADNGIGMDEAELISSIGTIAKSGTKSFVEAMSGDAKKDSNLIGQFGVGFYSVFMVASKVDVISKKAGQKKAYKWSSDGSGEFDITSCTKDSEGTVVYIKLKDEEKSDYTSKYKVQEVVKKYSNHIAYPIYLNYQEEVTQELSEKEKKANETKDEKDKIKPTTKLKQKREQINEAKALWTQPKAKLKKQEYQDFYKTLSHDSDEPMAYVHTKAEGVNNYTTLFYIPKKAPVDMYRVDYKPGVKLYVKRVFITDDEKELLPTYLRFVKGVIDSDDLPLNVSRELLQENKIMANIKQSSIKKVLNEIKKLSKKDDIYKEFISQYNRPLKEGAYQDYTNKDMIVELIRYKSTNDDKILTSLEDYKSRANTDQKAIYYLIGDSENMLRNSPLLESYTKNKIEVLILDDKEIDEVVTPSLGSYKEWELKDISAVDAPETKKDEKKQEKTKKEFEPLTKKIKDILGDEVKEVQITDRLDSSPSCVVKDPNDPMAQMAGMMKAMGQEVPVSPPILQINPNHKILKSLNESKDKKLIEDISHLLLDQAKLSEGLDIKDTVSYINRINSMLSRVIDK